MASERTIEALRQLAERPGTEAEGKVAREFLNRLTAHAPDAEASFRQYLRREVSLEELLRAMKPVRLTVEEQAVVDWERSQAEKRRQRIADAVATPPLCANARSATVVAEKGQDISGLGNRSGEENDRSRSGDEVLIESLEKSISP